VRRATAIGLAALVLFMIALDTGAVLESTGR
jgi:hypothetical protein